ncbi:hypothetical protein DPEC_G00147740 [Dallia pectoralis]|uniref:Uncharacterized protein n=1 Tax=Dallia pectoralis TaxID=75939 RepID=A0ACC2GIL4_DALPE|nr:hypothetical protein DPEC_G00147740 [Dallia pectoralis]
MAHSDKQRTHFADIIELNVGGQLYVTRHATLVSVPNSLLWTAFGQTSPAELPKDSKGRFFFDRDGYLFRYILDYLRERDTVLPDFFKERARLKKEADYFQLHELSERLRPAVRKENWVCEEMSAPGDPAEAAHACALGTTGTSSTPMSAESSRFESTVSSPTLRSPTQKCGYITVGYRGSYTIGRDIQTDAKFRRVARITVCGKTSLAKEVFGDTLNESRDPDRSPDRYTSRYYLKYNFLEQAFDRLGEVGFRMVACSSTGTCAYTSNDPNEDKIWTSYTEYVFSRD